MADRLGRKNNRVYLWGVGTLAAVLGVMLLWSGGTRLAGWIYGRLYAGQIYPGVRVNDVVVGGLTVDEAVLALQMGLPDASTLPIVLRDGERTWHHTWAELGFKLDALATARLAYRVGREGSPRQQRATRWRALFSGWPLSPVIQFPESTQVAEALGALADEVAIPAVNATLIIQPQGITPVPARAGRALDVEATVAALPYAVGFNSDGAVMELLTRPVEPAVKDLAPARSRVEELLSRPFELVADDPLTDAQATWSIAPSALITWLIAQPIERGDEAWLAVTIRENVVRDYLQRLDGQIAEGVVLDVDGTLPKVRAAVETGQHQAHVSLTHLPTTYVVRPGDTLMSIAYAHGFPIWRLEEANPGLEPGDLRPDQRIIIPSLDVLFPLPLITQRRIVVDISDQRLVAYDGDARIYDFVCSTGVDSSPTIPGKFQVLSKEPEAYASSWDLWMPYFMGIYRTGLEFTNGIHALPTLSNGVRLWEGVLGSPASYGCVVLGLDEAAMLYDWVELGTLVIIQE